MSHPSWQGLRDQFLHLCHDREVDSADLWRHIWELLVGDSWYQEQLASAASITLRSSRRPLEWRQDIEQEATVMLALRLQKKPCLGVNPVLATHHFGGWMRTIITRDCRNALRKLYKGGRFVSPLPECLVATDDLLSRDLRIDMAEALDLLEVQEKEVLMQSSKGHTLKQVAEIFDLPFWRTYRTYHRGLKNLRRLL